MLYKLHKTTNYCNSLVALILKKQSSKLFLHKKNKATGFVSVTGCTAKANGFEKPDQHLLIPFKVLSWTETLHF